jgi:hypothetical protein
MGNQRGLGFGAFLVGLGAGWLIFTALDVTIKTFAWILMILGAGIVASALLRYLSPKMSLSGAVSSLSAGLIIALIFTSGLGFVWPFSGTGGPYPHHVDESRNLKGDISAQNLLFSVENVNGQISVSTWDRPEYNIDLSVRAYGNTESGAQSNLQKVDTSVDERVVQGRLELTLIISVPRQAWNRYSVSVEATLPSDVTVDLDMQTTNGAITVEDLTGDSLVLKTTNGDITFDGVEATTIRASTTNGRIDGSVQASEMNADSTNGQIDLGLPSTRSGSYILGTTNGDVEITVAPSDEVGFDFDIRASSGTVSTDLAGLSYEINTNKNKVAHTEGFDDKSVQIEIRASTTNGNVRLGT